MQRPSFTIAYHGANKVPVWNGTFDVELAIGSCEISTAYDGWGRGQSDPCRECL